MAITVDIARTAYTGGEYALPPYTKGNDNADTPNPTWIECLRLDVMAGPETHIPHADGATGVDNTADAWVPHATITSLPSTPATVRF